MHQDVKGVVLAGVHRWRDSGLERAVVASLVPIANRPLIDYAMNWFRDGGITRIGVCANSDTEILRRWLGDDSLRHLEIDYREDELPRGPAGCTRDAALEDGIETAVAVDATVIPQSIDLPRLLEAHNRSHAAATIVVTPAEHDDIRSSPSLTPAGITVFHRRALGYIPAHGYQDIKETLIPVLYKAGERVATFQAEDAVPRVNDADACLSAEAWMLSRRLRGTRVPAGYRRSGDTLIHETARVGPGARLLGPCLIGPRSMVGGAATVVGPTTIGDSCIIGVRATICRSVLWDGAVLGAECSLDRCIVTAMSEVPGRTSHVCEVYCSSRRNAQLFRDD